MEQPISYELLNKIDSPEDLRHLPIESLPEVCKELRDKIIDELSPLGIVLDEEANDVRGEFRLITKEGSKIPCYIVPTDEEVMIARDTYNLIK